MKYQKLFWLLVFFFMHINLSYGQFLSNKGPIFDLSFLVGQKELVARYTPFKLTRAAIDKARIAKLKAQFNQRKHRKDFRIPIEFNYNSVNINDGNVYNHIPQSYKDRNGVYRVWEALEIEFGLCQGFTSSLRIFHYFAFFAPDLKIQYDRLKEPLKWQYEMEKIIDDVFNHRPTVIPEFTNLKELASSELGAYIERHVIDQWAINNISNNGVVNWLFGHEIENLDQLTRMRNQIKWMVDRGFHPKLMLHANGGYDTNPHVVRAMDVGDVVALDNYADGGYTQEDIENLKNEIKESTNKEQTKMLKYELREAKFNLENAGKTRYCFDYLQLETFGMVFREFICVGDKDLIMQNETAVFMEYYNKLTKFCKDRPYLCKNKRI